MEINRKDIEELVKEKELELEDLKVTNSDAINAFLLMLVKIVMVVPLFTELPSVNLTSTRALKNNVKSFVQIIENKAKNNEFISLPTK